MRQADIVKLGARWLRFVRRAAARVESAQIRRTGSSVLAQVFHTDVLVLITTGRRTGRSRRTPLAYASTPDGWLISGGAAGQPRVDWIANLRASADAQIVVKRRTHQVTASEPTGTDYDSARALVLQRWPRVLGYEAASGRAVPIFRLHTRPARNNPV